MKILGTILAALFVLFPSAAHAAPLQAGIAKVQETGNPHGRPVVLIPGLGCGPWIWSEQVKALSPAYHLFLVTLPGFDGMPFAPEKDLTQSAADAIHELVVSQHLHHAIVVGHSLGGTVAVLYGEAFAGDGSSIVTVEGGYPVAKTQAARNQSVARSVAPYIGLPQAKLAAALYQNMLQYTVTNPKEAKHVADLSARSSPDAIVVWMRSALSRDLTPNLGRITGPFTAIIPFDQRIDPYVGYPTAQQKLATYTAWVKHTPHGRVLLVQPSRHFVMVDRPDVFEATLQKVLTSS